MKRSAELIPAPRRGQYDRSLGRRERQAAQRDRVIAAITELAASGAGLSVAKAAELAGIGRNTFYEYFDDIEHALESVKARAVRHFSERVEENFRDAHPPLERIGALARAWAEHLFEAPALAQVALRPQLQSPAPSQVSVLAQRVIELLGEEVDARVALPGLNEPLRLLVVAALFDTVSRSHFTVSRSSFDELQRVLTDLAQRLLR